jgi:hypothetical protein
MQIRNRRVQYPAFHSDADPDPASQNNAFLAPDTNFFGIVGSDPYL